MESVYINALVEKYYDTGLYLAVSTDRRSVVGTGKTIEEPGSIGASQSFRAYDHVSAVILRVTQPRAD